MMFPDEDSVARFSGVELPADWKTVKHANFKALGKTVNLFLRAVGKRKLKKIAKEEDKRKNDRGPIGEFKNVRIREETEWAKTLSDPRVEEV